MSRSLRPRRPAAPRCARGVTLVELLVTLAIAAFLLGGLLTIVTNTRTTFGNQNALAQLQDSERLAMTLLGDVVQQAGYFPDPTTNTLTSALPADLLFPVAGRSISGLQQGGAPEDSILVRYMTAPGDGIINCTGGSNPVGAGAPVLYENVFSIDANGNLVCSLNGAAPVVLIGAVGGTANAFPAIQNLQVWYGVQTNTALGNGAVDSWLRANEMTATFWNNVIAVKLVVFFSNPLWGQPNQPQTIRVERVVAVMNRGGVKT
ncbi:MAG: PilW family protein [Proteobacteria bacterium]|nr:PilW family protein [Pseudomonadota bacterium]